MCKAILCRYHKPLILCLLLVFCEDLQGQTVQQWYNQAQERIDTLRRGSFGIEIYDKDGQAYDGPVKVRMAKHEFPFGIAFDFYEGEITTDVPTETQWMKAAMYKYFNYGTSGNSFKWSGIQPQNTAPNYTNFENALNWAQKVGWELRAHTLLWGGTTYEDDHPTPRWVKDLSTPEEILAACEERVKREVGRYKGVVKEYDVINEPVHATYLQSLVGDSLNWKCFQWAREADPEARLYINEYNVEYGWGDADEYRELIEEVIANGGPVTGIGMQAHFWDCCRPNITEFVTQIDKLATIGLPIRLTEFDFGGNLTEAEQAEDFIKVMTIAFSHPSITGVIYWNLADHLSWRENAGLLRADHRPKLAADTLLYLTKELWATNFDAAVTGGEALSFDAYYGNYNIEVQFGDTIKQFSIPLHEINKDSIFQLHEYDALVKGPELIKAQLVQWDELELLFDQPIDPASIDKYDFRVFASNGISINTIFVREGADSVLVFDLSNEIPTTDYPEVSYFPGSLASEQGGKALAFGVERIIIGPELNEAPTLANQSFDIADGAQLGTLVGSVVASDPEGAPLTYTIIAGNDDGIFHIDQNSGKLTIINYSLLDYNSSPFELTIEVSDGVHTVDALVTIDVLKITGTTDDRSGNLTVFPNPAREILTISSEAGLIKTEIYDLRGKLLYLKNYPHPVNKDVLTLNLKNGAYLLKIADGTDVKTSKVIIK